MNKRDMRYAEKNLKTGKHKSNHSSNFIKCEWIKNSKEQQRLSEWIF